MTMRCPGQCVYFSLHQEQRSRYSEVTETITSFHADADDMEQEIDSLRALLREFREQRERAVHACESADKERDEYILRYKEKCRELERDDQVAVAVAS